MGRAKVPPPPADPAVRLAQLTARHDQALAVVEDGLRRAGRNRALADVLLDLRNVLRPPAEGRAG